MILAQFHDGNSAWLLKDSPPMSKPPGFGLGLAIMYVCWIIEVGALHPQCWWFGGVKQGRKDWCLSYM